MTTPLETSVGTPNPITLAGFTDDGDAHSRVLLMQLTVPQGSVITGAVGITINNGAMAGATTTLQNQFFSFPPPNTCCLPDSTCASFSSEPECTKKGGHVVGIGIVPCALCLGACCANDGTCSLTSPTACADKGGTFHGSGSTCGTSCTFADISGDARIGVDDLLAVISGWGPCPWPCAPCAGDLNASCATNVSDLLIVIENWSP